MTVTDVYPKRRGLRVALVALGLAVSLAFTYIAVRDVDFGDFWSALGSSNYWWLLPALAALVVTVFLKALRWWVLFPRESRPPLAPVTSSLIIGQFFNNVFPLRAGEAARVVALHLQARTSMAEAAGTVVSERIYDALTLLAVLLLAQPLLPEVAWIGAAGVLAGVGLALVLAMVVLLAVYGSRPFLAIARLLARLPGVPLAPLERAAEGLVRGLAGFREVRIAAATLALTVGSTLTLALMYWFVMVGFDLGVGFGAGVLMVIATNLAMILPSSPAAVGVFEAATLVTLNAYGIDDSSALSYAVVVHAADFLPFVVFGYAALHWHALSVRQARRLGDSQSAPTRSAASTRHGA